MPCGTKPETGRTTSSSKMHHSRRHLTAPHRTTPGTRLPNSPCRCFACVCLLLLVLLRAFALAPLVHHSPARLPTAWLLSLSLSLLCHPTTKMTTEKKKKHRHRRQRTPLHCAAKGNTTAVTRYLISAGADTEARTAYKMTPLHVAAFYGSADVMRLLLEEVQDLDIDALDFGSCKSCSVCVVFPPFHTHCSL